jgi:hypothetical protein
MNFESLLEIDVNYGGSASWAAIASGVKTVSQALNEVVAQDQYYDGEGFAESEVTGAQYIVSVTCDRVAGDTAQDYILGLQFLLGCNRKTQARFTNYQGDVKSGVVTIANIAPPGGDAAAKGEWSFELHFKAKPTLAVGATAPELSATIAAGSVAGTTKFTATAGAGNTLGYLLTAAVPTAPNVGAYVSVFAYTSASNIVASVGQVLNMFELDENGRVVLFATEVLEAGDIASA